MEPTTNDPGAWARTYMSLGWPVALGHRKRPREGCTCQNPACPSPGAHPGPEGPRYLTEDQLALALETTPGASLIVGTAGFDAVTVERYAGMYIMVHLEHSVPLPLLLTHETATFLVRPGTGGAARVHDSVDVQEGARGWVALPPSHGAHWDTPPWDELSIAPRGLAHGSVVGKVLECMSRTYLDGTRRAGAAR